MKRLITFLSILSILLTSCGQRVTEWPMLLFDGDYPDPSILVDGNDYYMTFTSFDNNPGLPIWHSTDLVNWEIIGNALNTDMGNVWAPDIQKVDGRYFIYFPADYRIYVVWADNIRGPWSEPVDLDLTAIDPGLGVAEDGSRYLFVNDGYMTKLSDDGLCRIGEISKAYEAWKIPEDWIVECQCLESPKAVKRGDWYYMVSAEGGTSGPATSHMAIVHRSHSLEGPWEECPDNPLIHTYSDSEQWWSKGHATLFEDADGRWWIVYHAYRSGRHDLGRHTLLEPISWTEEGWPVADRQARRMK